ncbi:MAG: peroxiredoxin [Gammaproteobacteria bacterium]|nr:peroxiredoxin [Gammaproteobacteria bacterium]
MGVLVGRKAPDFTVPAVLGNGEIVSQFNCHEALQGRYGLIFFYPLDFTFVCPSELIALDHRIDAFKKRHVEVMAVSIDSQFTHNAYRKTSVKDGGIGPVHYTLVADVTHGICQSYGVEHPVAGVAFRAAFIIDKKGVVRAQVVNDLPIGRDIDELLRLVDAIQYTDEHGEVCPAGWKPGQAGMKASPDGVAAYLASHADEL